MRQEVPNASHLERSDRGIVPELSNDDVDCSLADLIASDQVQRQPVLNASWSAM